MALNTTINKPSVKYGAAKDLLFGTKRSADFDVLESTSATASFDREVTVKNEVGNTVGIIQGDPKLELTLNGMGATAPKALGAITELEVMVGAVGANAAPSANGDSFSFCVTSVKEDRSNEDFVKYEVSGSHYFNVDYTQTKDLSDEDS